MRGTLRSLLALLLLAAAAAVQAQSFGLGDGYFYSINASNADTITIIGYNGPGGAVSIPTNINGLTVNSIGSGGKNEVFAGTGATVVVIPGSVNSIGAEAFKGCASLTSVITAGSVTNLGEDAFADCTNLTSVYFNSNPPSADASVFNSDTNATVYYLAGTTNWSATFAGLPAVMSTAPDQFSYTTNAGTITITGFSGGSVVIIPDAINGLLVASIGTNTIYDGIGDTNGSGDTSLTIPYSVTNIGEEAFVNWRHLTSVSIPGSVAIMGNDAFYFCPLGSATIANGVTSIGDGAFQDCLNLTNVTIPDSVTSFGADAFYDCQNLNSIMIGNNITNIGPGAFAASDLTSVSIPGSIASIGEWAFGSCALLASVTIEEGVTSIGDYAFNSSGLRSVTIPGSITNIGDAAFEGCLFLGTVTIPSGVTSIGDAAFNGSDLWGSMMIPGSVTNIGASAFSEVSLASVFFTGNAPTADPTAFYNGISDITTIYYLPGTAGWSSLFAGRPAVLWNPLIQACGANFGVRNNQFGFTVINGAPTNIPIVVEACTNLASPVWTPLLSLTLSNSFYFSDPQWTNYSARYYGLGFP